MYGLKVLLYCLGTSVQTNFIGILKERNVVEFLTETIAQLGPTRVIEDITWLRIFTMVLEISAFFIVEKPSKSTGAECSAILDHCLALLEAFVGKEEVNYINANHQKHEENLDSEFLQSLFLLARNCIITNPADITKLYAFGSMEALIDRLIIFHKNDMVKKEAAKGIINFLELDDIILKTKGLQAPTIFFYGELLDQKLPSLIAMNIGPDQNAYTFFELSTEILRQVSKFGNTVEQLQVHKIAETLYQEMINRPILEHTENEFDSILAGGMKLLKNLDDLFSDELKRNGTPVFDAKFLVRDCLFKRDKRESDVVYPLCKNEKTRLQALELLIQLCNNREENIFQIADNLSENFSKGAWRSNKKPDWFLSPAKVERRKTFVGLVNLGCTCYMNSLMQQLYMIPHFRKLIMMTKDRHAGTVPEEDNVLYQSKLLFSNLMKSERPVHNPIDFFKSIKDYDGTVMPTNEQRDVDEFLNIYMDKIETATKGTDTEHMFNSIFGGTFAQELICKDCPH